MRPGHDRTAESDQGHGYHAVALGARSRGNPQRESPNAARATVACMATEFIHLSGIINRPLVDAKTGDRLGRVRDLIVRLGMVPRQERQGQRPLE